MELRKYPYTLTFTFIGLLLGAITAEFFTYYVERGLLAGFAISLPAQAPLNIPPNLFWQAIGACLGGVILGLPTFFIEHTRRLKDVSVVLTNDKEREYV